MVYFIIMVDYGEYFIRFRPQTSKILQPINKIDHTVLDKIVENV